MSGRYPPILMMLHCPDLFQKSSFGVAYWASSWVRKKKGRTLLLYSLVILEITKKGNFQFSKLPSLPWLLSPLKIIYLSALLAFCLSCSVSVCSPSAKYLAVLSFKPLPLLLLQSAATPFLYLNPAELKFCLHEVLLRRSPHRRLLLLNSCFSSHLLHSSGFSLMMEGGIWFSCVDRRKHS